MLRSLFDVALQLAQSTRPQDGSTAAYILRFLLRLPSFGAVLQTYSLSKSSAAEDDDDDDDDDDTEAEDSCYRCLCLLLQLLQRQLDVATVNLLEASGLSVSCNGE